MDSPLQRHDSASPPADWVLEAPVPGAGLHRIVIVGGGAAGSELAALLGADFGRSGRAEVLLVDPALTHVWKPLLHEMAAGTLHAHDGEADFMPQARRHHYRFHPGRMDGLDRGRREVLLAPLVDDDGLHIAPRRAIGYDTLVLCLGSVVNDFGLPGVRRHALTLDSAADAHHLHRRLLGACARAEVQGQGPVQVAVVGGGATGVELAAELVEAVDEISSYGLRLRRLPRPAVIRILETGPRLLAALPEETAARAQHDLQRRGVELRLQAQVAEVGADHVRLQDGESVPADIVVWCAGIQGPAVLARLEGLDVTKARQLRVRPTLQVVGDDDIFALGDCALCPLDPQAAPGEDAGTVPPRAQAAHQQARFLAAALRERLAHRPLPVFRYRERGALVSTGRSQAVGSLVALFDGQRIGLHGLLAAWSYRALQRGHMARLHGPWRMALAVLGDWLGRRSGPRVKLH